MGTTLVHTLKEITRSDAAAKRFGPCILEADIDVRGDGVYVNVRDYSLGDDYTLVGFAALRIENGKLVLVSSSNEQLDVGGGDESRSDVYDPEEPYPSERREAQSEAQEAESADTEDDWARYRQEEGLDVLREDEL